MSPSTNTQLEPRPEWTRLHNAKVVWREDDADCGTPEHETLKVAWRRIFGVEYPAICLVSWDAVHATFRLFPEGRVAICSTPGESEIRVLLWALPEGDGGDAK